MPCTMGSCGTGGHSRADLAMRMTTEKIFIAGRADKLVRTMD